MSWVPVLDGERRVVGTLAISDVVRAYRSELAASAERVSEMGTMTGTALVTIGGPLADCRTDIAPGCVAQRPVDHVDHTRRPDLRAQRRH